MTDTSETAEISYCASILAKAFKNNDEAAFTDFHDVLRAYLEYDELSEDELDKVLLKVEDLARKYTDLPIFVLEKKIEWYKSHGVRPINFISHLHAVAIRKPGAKIKTLVNELDTEKENDTEASKPILSDVLRIKGHEKNDNDIFLTSTQNETGLNDVYRKSDEIQDAARAFVTAGSYLNNSKTLDYQFIEMKELNPKIKTMEDEVSAKSDLTNHPARQPESLSMKKKNKKKKKKTKSEMATTAEEVTEPIAKSEVPVKSSRNARRRRFTRSKKEIENENIVSNSFNEKQKKSLPEKLIFENNNIKTKEKEKFITDKNQVCGSEQANILRDELMMQNAALCSETNTQNKNIVLEQKHKNTSSTPHISKDRMTKKLFISDPCDSKEKACDFSWNLQENLKELTNTSGSRSDVFSKPTVTYSVKSSHMLDSAGGSIASSSEDNSSTASSSVTECNGDPGVLPAKTYFTALQETTANICAEQEAKEGNCLLSHSVMLFGNHWNLPVGNTLTRGAKNQHLKETEVESLLSNDWGLEFFDRQVQEESCKQKTNLQHYNDPGILNFMCASARASPLLDDVMESTSTMKIISIVDNEPVANRDVKDLSNKKEKIDMNKASKLTLDKQHLIHNFDHYGAVRFLWKEWKQMSI